MSRTFRVTGTKQLQKALRAKATLDDVKNVVKKNGSAMTTKAQRLSPVDTGELKRSIKTEVGLGGYESTTKAEASYAPYIEYGTRFSAAKPFVKPSYDNQKKIFIKDLSLLLKKVK